MRYRALWVAIAVMSFASCSTEPDHYNGPTGQARIRFDSSTFSSSFAHYSGDSSFGGLEIGSYFDKVGPFQLYYMTVVVSPFKGATTFAVDTATRVMISSDVAPFTFWRSDSGSITILSQSHDTVLGSFNVRLKGDDSSVHRMSGNFIAVPYGPID